MAYALVWCFSYIAQQHGHGPFEAGSAFTTGSTLGTWYYMLTIRLVDLHSIFKELGLLANPQIRLTLKKERDTVILMWPVGLCLFLLPTMTSGITCPVMIVSGTVGNTMNGIITGATVKMRLVFGVLQNTITTNF